MLIDERLDLQDRAVARVRRLGLEVRALQQRRRVDHPVVRVLQHALEVRHHLLGREAVLRVRVRDVEALREQDRLVERVEVRLLVADCAGARVELRRFVEDAVARVLRRAHRHSA